MHLEHTAFRINSIIRPSYRSSIITEELIIQDDNLLIKGLLKKTKLNVSKLSIHVQKSLCRDSCSLTYFGLLMGLQSGMKALLCCLLGT